MKNGIEYFPLNTNFFDDDKIALIEVDHGYLGSYVLIRIMSKIYDSEGYYCHWGEDERKLFVKRIGGRDFDLAKLDAIVESSFNRDFFDRTIYEKYGVLTSRGIQKRFLEAVSRRQAQVYREYLLVPEAIAKYGNVKFVSINESVPGPAPANNNGSPGSVPQQQREPARRSNPAPAGNEQPGPADGFPGATITRRGKKPSARKISDELKILSHFFFQNFVSPEKQLDKFIRNNELMHANKGGWAKMSSTTRLAACMEWKQMDDNKKIITDVRFPSDKKPFLDAWQKLFNTLAYQYDTSEDILTDMVRDNVKWVNRLVYCNEVKNNFQLGASERLITFLQENRKIFDQHFKDITNGLPVDFVPLPIETK